MYQHVIHYLMAQALVKPDMRELDLLVLGSFFWCDTDNPFVVAK